MGGTKCPSMTSKCTQSAPACSRAATASPNRLKSADRSEGAISTLGNGRDADRHRRVEVVVGDDHVGGGVDGGPSGQLAAGPCRRTQRAQQLVEVEGVVGSGADATRQGVVRGEPGLDRAGPALADPL